MFGSDWPVCELAAPYPAVLALTESMLSSAERAAVLATTAQRVYRLP
jgi:L-fuconolactonase